jgi:hypothetical protein
MNTTHAIAVLTAGLFLLSSHTTYAKSRTCRLVFPERPRDAPKMAYLFDGSRNISVHLPSMNLSEVFSLPGGELTILLSRDEIKDPEILPPNAPRLRIPETVGDFYIILTPDKDNADLPVKMNLVDIGRGKLKPGETLWFNFTDHRIVAKLSETEMAIAPKGRVVSKPPAPASGYYAARFAFQANGTGALAPITEQSWWHDAACRHLGFMVNTGGKLPKIYYFRDFRNPEPTGDTQPVSEVEE